MENKDDEQKAKETVGRPMTISKRDRGWGVVIKVVEEDCDDT